MKHYQLKSWFTYAVALTCLTILSSTALPMHQKPGEEQSEQEKEGEEIEEREYSRNTVKRGKKSPKETIAYASKLSKLVRRAESIMNLTLVSTSEDPVTDKTLSLLKDFSNLKVLNLSGCTNITSDALSNLPKSLTKLNLRGTHIMDTGCLFHYKYKNRKNLIALDLSDSEITDDGLKNLRYGNGNSLTNLNLGDTKIGNVGLRYAVRKCPDLTELDLSGCFNIENDGFRTIAKCSKLTALDLSKCRKITDGALKLLPKTINKLSLSGCEEITDDGLLYIAEHFPDLTVLDLSNTKVTDDGIQAIAKHCKKLTHLDLQRCTNITGTSIEVVAEHCSNITALYLNGCFQITITGIQNKKPLIEPLISVRRPQDIGTYLLQLTQLTELGLGNSGIVDDDLELIGEHLSKLTILDLSDTKITGTGLHHLKDMSLTTLNLSGCENISDVGLTYLPTSLTELHLVGCSKITNAALEFLPRFTQLTKLRLGHCREITNEGLKHVGELDTLTELELLECHSITDDGLSPMVRLKNLRSLVLCGCNDITDAGVKSLGQQMYWLKIIDTSESKRKSIIHRVKNKTYRASIGFKGAALPFMREHISNFCFYSVPLVVLGLVYCYHNGIPVADTIELPYGFEFAIPFGKVINYMLGCESDWPLFCHK